MQARAVGVTLQDDRASVVEQCLIWRPAEIGKGLAQAVQPRITVLAGTETHDGGTAVAKRGDEALSGLRPLRMVVKSTLQLLAGRGLQARHRVMMWAFEWRQVAFKLADAACIALSLDLTNSTAAEI